MKKYFVYRHIRPDKNKVFYIGIGTINTKENTFIGQHYRAYNRKKSRNNYWKNIVKLNPDYKIQIIYYSDNIEEIQEKEKEFILLYKKTLCNLTEGGLGINSYKHLENTKKSISKTMKGRKCTKEHIKNMNKRKFKPIIVYNNTFYKEFNSIKECINHFNWDNNYYPNISRCLHNKVKTAYKYKFKFKNTELRDKELLG